jgi:hypothetical protein
MCISVLKIPPLGAFCASFIQPERRGRVVSTPALYSGGPGFESRPRRPAVLIEGFCGFLQSLQAIFVTTACCQILPIHRLSLVTLSTLYSQLLRERRKVN